MKFFYRGRGRRVREGGDHFETSDLNPKMEKGMMDKGGGISHSRPQGN
jgi:hypothetical protein